MGKEGRAQLTQKSKLGSHLLLGHAEGCPYSQFCASSQLQDCSQLNVTIERRSSNQIQDSSHKVMAAMDSLCKVTACRNNSSQLGACSHKLKLMVKSRKGMARSRRKLRPELLSEMRDARTEGRDLSRKYGENRKS